MNYIIKIIREKNASPFVCPECGSMMIPESGCMYCRICGFTSCLI